MFCVKMNRCKAKKKYIFYFFNMFKGEGHLILHVSLEPNEENIFLEDKKMFRTSGENSGMQSNKKHVWP